MARLPQAFIDQVLDRTDIVDVVDRRVKLKKAGKNYSACCPFHQEKHPPFLLSPKSRSTTSLVVVQVVTLSS